MTTVLEKSLLLVHLPLEYTQALEPVRLWTISVFSQSTCVYNVGLTATVEHPR